MVARTVKLKLGEQIMYKFIRLLKISIYAQPKVKGPTVLSMICYDHVLSTAVNEMHCVFQGVTKKLMAFWFGTEYRTHPSSLFAFVNIIDNKIKGITLPSFIPRIPRKISEYAYWKATELQTFLLIYSLPLLKDFMSEQYLITTYF